MKKVICINDKKLPPGAQVIKDQEYEIESEFINSFDQRVFIIAGITNEGRTKFGLPWIGYNSERFANVESLSKKEKAFDYALN
jgi:hypothetical protein